MPRDNRLPTQEQLLEFSEVYTRAIAQSWKDPVFEKLLVNDPRAALQKYFGYIPPWSANIVVKRPDKRYKGWHKNKEGKWSWDLPNNAIVFGVPTAPALEERPVALAAYNDAGPTYLFTCC